MGLGSCTEGVYAISLTSEHRSLAITLKFGIAHALYSCASFPLVALGVLHNTNGVGVTQAINIFFHAPASL